MKINRFLDATYLKTAEQSNISEEENQQIVTDLLHEAILYEYKLVMFRAKYISLAKNILLVVKSSVLVGTVVGFHLGEASAQEKLIEAQKAIDLGADELDFVVNYKAFKEGKVALVKEEIFLGTKLSIENSKVIKWIIEIAALTDEEIIVISRLIKQVVLENFGKENAKNVFVKSSTGFFKTKNNLPNGATLKAMQMIVENAKPLKVKAAGGVRDYKTAQKMITLGVDRIGTSASKEICIQEQNIVI